MKRVRVQMSERRVLQVCHGYEGPFLDCARQYASLFEGSQYKVTTVYLKGAPSQEAEQGSASDEVIFLGYQSKDLRGLKLKVVHDLRRIIAGHHFNLCIAHRFKSIYVALLASNLSVIGVHHAFGGYRRLSRRLFANMFRHRLFLLGVSQAVRDELRGALPGWSESRIETLYNRLNIEAAEMELFSREEAREKLDLPHDAWIVGNAGRLHPDKDQATLIRGFAKALPQLPADSLLVIMGSGRLERDLQQLTETLEVSQQVRFLGQVPAGRRYFKAFDGFVLSSDHEPFGMVLLEAMVAGVPLIATDCGGGREVVRDVGELFPLGDVSALAEHLTRQVQLTAADLKRLRLGMTERLRQDFSDSAARSRFRSLFLEV